MPRCANRNGMITYDHKISTRSRRLPRWTIWRGFQLRIAGAGSG